jgi:O-antigen ligase
MGSVPGPNNDLALTLTRVGAGFVGAALIFSFWASPDRVASLPWFLIGLVGVLLVLLVSGPFLAALRRRIGAAHLLWFFLAIGYTTLIVTFLTTRWPAYKLSWLNTVYAALPSIRSVPWWWTQAGLQPNQTGGMMAVCTAFAVAVTLARDVRGRYRWPALFLSLVGFVAVFMTGSRAALAGLVVSLLAVIVARTSRWLWVWVPGLALVVLGLLASGTMSRIVDFFVHDETVDTKLVARLDIWTSALHGIQDHFFSGIGLGVFNQVIPFRYPYHTVGLSYPVSQAHNLLLDTALSIGVPGAIGFVVVIVGVLTLSVRGSKQQGLSRVVCLAILASVTVYLVFGITDSISLTIPTSFVLWLWVCALVLLCTAREKDTIGTRNRG